MAGLTAAVAAVWADVLRVAEVGDDDEFSALGGDVRTASRVVALTNQWLGANLTLRQLFLHRTPARLAAALHAEGVRVREVGPSAAGAPAGEWERFWDSTYRFSARRRDGFNTAGWYDRRALGAMPEAHMREWVGTTAERLRSLRPRHVLEIGCGLGLIMMPMLEHVERYEGTDISTEAVRGLREHLAGHPHGARAAVRRGDALEVAAGTSGEHDLVLLNSVVQYFPDLAHLEEVVAGLTRGDGVVFLGDLLHRGLHRPMHVAQVVEQFPDSAPVRRVRTATEVSLAGDAPLLVGPDELRRLVARAAPGWDCDLLVRRGTHRTEMNRFRFDAVLSRGRHPNSDAPVRPLSWPGNPGGVAEVLATLVRPDDERVVIRSVPDARTHACVRLTRALDEAPEDLPLAELRDGLAPAAAVDPETLWETGHRLGHGVAVAPAREPGLVDVALLRGGDDWAAAALLRAPGPGGEDC
ncbi:class I SAM-dependent methyltransferase [Actinophytocola xanthii]|uniref:class I SAM-dependent methyltransferase n=1 Tax=Actinophytocola xanthii TaxID=1912961 RepID=UPI00130132C8|nr:class I SAM-dependent methyltransferase [Actinophytocola xanthii]